MSPKLSSGIVGITVGTAAVVAVAYWPGQTAYIQMLMCSVLVLGAVLSGIWSRKNQANFFSAILLLFAGHGLFLYAIRAVFPFRSVLLVFPLMFVEALIAFVLMIRFLGDPDDIQHS